MTAELALCVVHAGSEALVKDLKFEQKRSLSRLEAADQLTALAAALREGGDVELAFGPGMLSLRIPDDLRTEIEVEVGDGEVELEFELKWPTVPTRAASARAGTSTDEAAKPRKATRPKESTSRKAASAGPTRSSAGAGRSRAAKSSAAKTA
ncbi:amphi-Trp domain-containing protein [Streptomyces rishiriensis]|uniref:Amphi-Trp domain-containing protein n=1 Tax=Streptomyces rishiriensis TaxID=68264 RepID=A0ABU0P2D7_STRRH|nr:amphi-Trp domain-containing protein [Streptomyces rishiriensis]MDQ0585529.1 amphi-Trp domain-containing protein [Streptomyces rishiriensis]